jgi:hypothetical protein
MGAGKIIRKLTERGIIKRVRNYVPRQFAARYTWCLEIKSQDRKKKK